LQGGNTVSIAAPYCHSVGLLLSITAVLPTSGILHKTNIFVISIMDLTENKL